MKYAAVECVFGALTTETTDARLVQVIRRVDDEQRARSAFAIVVNRHGDFTRSGGQCPQTQVFAGKLDGVAQPLFVEVEHGREWVGESVA